MKGQVKPIPKGYHSVTPYLIVNRAADALAFYGKAFGATEVLRMPGPDNTIMHAEIQVGDSRIMLADENPTMKVRSPHSLKGTTASLMVYVENVDTFFAQAVKAGGTAVREVQTMFWGDRCGTLADPFGHVWELATHVEDVSAEEMHHRMMSGAH